MNKVNIALYGSNGHQVSDRVIRGFEDKINVVAYAKCQKLSAFPHAKEYDTLEELLCCEGIDLISLASPVRANQADEAILCMERGIHVYAEKPCALCERDLDRIIAAKVKTGKEFHEMAGTAFENPYYSMQRLVAEGAIGDVVQVFAQKSYPLNIENRPQDENVDGGLTLQAGVHAARFVEHVAGVKIAGMQAVETQNGNTKGGGLRTASSLMFTLENGGVGSMIVNYLNPKEGFGLHGNEHLRIFGTKGFIEATDGGKRTRLVVQNEDFGEIDMIADCNYFEMYVDSLLGNGVMPMAIEEELHPLRMLIRAKNY